MRKTPFSIFIITFTIILILTGGGYIGRHAWKHIQYDNANRNIAWQTYRDHNYNFELRFPVNWKIQTPTDFGYITFYNPKFANPEKNWSNGGMINILILKNVQKYSLKEFLDRINIHNKKEISLEGFLAFGAETELEFFPEDINTTSNVQQRIRRNVWISDAKLERFILIQLDYPNHIRDQKYDQIFVQVISSFKTAF